MPKHKPSQRSLRFTQRRDFQKTINERVETCLRDQHLPARDVPAMYLKTVLVLVWWLGAYLALLLVPYAPLLNGLLCLNWALSIVSLGLNVTHDSNHGAYSNHPASGKEGRGTEPIAGLDVELDL